MTALAIQQADYDRSQAVRAELSQVLQEGAKVGANTVIDKIFATPPQAAAIKALLDTLESVSVAITRLGQAGTSPFPVQLPIYSLPTVPNAATNAGSVIYVANGANGFPIVAFSDGSVWVRVDTKTQISAT